MGSPLASPSGQPSKLHPRRWLLEELPQNWGGGGFAAWWGTGVRLRVGTVPAVPARGSSGRAHRRAGTLGTVPTATHPRPPAPGCWHGAEGNSSPFPSTSSRLSCFRLPGEAGGFVQESEERRPEKARVPCQLLCFTPEECRGGEGSAAPPSPTRAPGPAAGCFAAAGRKRRAWG